MGNAQDDLIGKMFSKKEKKQEGLRQTVCQILFRHGVEERDKCYDCILQQVIEWIESNKIQDTTPIDTVDGHDIYMQRIGHNDCIEDLSSQLKEGKA